MKNFLHLWINIWRKTFDVINQISSLRRKIQKKYREFCKLHWWSYNEKFWSWGLSKVASFLNVVSKEKFRKKKPLLGFFGQFKKGDMKKQDKLFWLNCKSWEAVQYLHLNLKYSRFENLNCFSPLIKFYDDYFLKSLFNDLIISKKALHCFFFFFVIFFLILGFVFSIKSDLFLLLVFSYWRKKSKNGEFCLNE